MFQQDRIFRLAHILRLCLTIACLFSAQSTAAGAPFSISDYIVELDEEVGGNSLHTYANEWWKWAYSMQQNQSPIRDRNGSHCGVNQQGPVWYLAGGFGTTKIDRACVLPAQKHIFFPVINIVHYTPPDSDITCEEAKKRAAENNNNFVYIRVFLNGSQLENAQRFRLASKECFNLFERVPEEFNAPSVAPSATDGYWIMMKPLPPGTHKLEFRAFYTNQGTSYGDMVQNISYELTILAE